MKLGLQISSFTWPGGPPALAETFGRVVRTADEVGFDSIWVMDHFFQIRSVGRPEEPMLEGYTALGYAAALAQRARLGLMVGGIHYRQAGLWAKAATTLDVLTGGRSYFGIGAAWNEEESRGLGFPFPPLRDRFQMLDETLQIVTAMWDGRSGTGERFEGTHVRAERLLNSPQALSRPHPPILVGGGGERKTLRLVAQYADACNIFGGPERLTHKFGILREHCDALGRDYDAIEKTNLSSFDVSADGGAGTVGPTEMLDRLGGWAGAGSQHTIFSVKRVADVSKLELIGRDVIPHVRSLGTPSPIV
jgi:F420-dependent oxidoreductase-like protein